MDEREILELIEGCGRNLPRFDDGRINYKGAKRAPVLNIVVKHKGKILLLKRSDQVATYKGKWMVIGGYLDEICPLHGKILEELREELSIGEGAIEKITFGGTREIYDSNLDIHWILCGFIVDLKEESKIKLDWEHTEYKWIKPKEIEKFDTVPNLGVLISDLLEENLVKHCF